MEDSGDRSEWRVVETVGLCGAHGRRLVSESGEDHKTRKGYASVNVPRNVSRRVKDEGRGSEGSVERT